MKAVQGRIRREPSVSIWQCEMKEQPMGGMRMYAVYVRVVSEVRACTWYYNNDDHATLAVLLCYVCCPPSRLVLQLSKN
jgi:hypothetical protein